MRANRLPLGLCLLLLSCSNKEPPPPTEYIQFIYQVNGGAETPMMMPIVPGSLPCSRQLKEISVKAEKGKASFQIQLKDAATMPAQLQARTITSGKVNVDVVVPVSVDMAGGPTIGFSSADPGDLFTCNLRILGPDPFLEFKATFSCDSKMTAAGRLTITEGEARAVLCY